MSKIILAGLATLSLGYAMVACMASPVSAQGYTGGYYHGPRDGYCWNNKRGC